MKWYLDCFTDEDEANRKFPVNTFCHSSVEFLSQTAVSVLKSKVSGIKSVRLSRTTLGKNPRNLEDIP